SLMTEYILSMNQQPPSTPFVPYTTLFRSRGSRRSPCRVASRQSAEWSHRAACLARFPCPARPKQEARWFRLTTREESSRKPPFADRKSTRLNSSHVKNSYAVFCSKKKITL